MLQNKGGVNVTPNKGVAQNQQKNLFRLKINKFKTQQT